MLLAQNLDSIQNIGIPLFRLRGGRITGISGLFTLVLPYVFYGAGIALLVYLVLGGLQLMTSRGDPKAVQGAQAKITNAIIGFIVIIFSIIIVALIGKIFGIGSFGLIFGY